MVEWFFLPEKLGKSVYVGCLFFVSMPQTNLQLISRRVVDSGKDLPLLFQVFSELYF